MKKDNNLKLFEVPSKRLQECLDLYNQNLTPLQISEYMGVSVGTIWQYKNRLRKMGLINNNGHLNLRVANHRELTEYEAELQDFIHAHDELFDVSSYVRFVTLEQVKDVIKELGYKKQDIRLLLNVYAERHLFEEMINLLNSYEANNELSEEEAKKIYKFKHVLRRELLKELKDDVPEYFLQDEENER